MKPTKEYKGRSHIRMFNVDCMDFMEQVDEPYDLAIVDPPYGISVDNTKPGNFVMTKHSSKNWDGEKPKKEYWYKLFDISKDQLVFGGNYFDLPKRKGWICWDKVNPLKGKFSDFELAWTSFLNCDRIYREEWIGFGRNFREKPPSIHPTQKPIRMYRWILKNYANEGDKIFDTHGGSMSIAIACWDLGFDLDICELDTDYFNDAVKRFEQHIAQKQMVFS